MLVTLEENVLKVLNYVAIFQGKKVREEVKNGFIEDLVVDGTD